MKSCKNQKVNLVFALLATLLLSFGAALPVIAQGIGSLTVTYDAVDSAEFHLYRIGSIDEESMQLDYLPAYAKYRSILDLANTDALNALTSKQMTDAAAQILLSGPCRKTGTVKNLPEGVFLLTGEDVTVETDKETHVYHALPMIVMVPQFVPSNGTYNYEAKVSVKPSMEVIPHEPETKTYSVKKVFINDEGYPRPDGIQVEIIRGTAVWQTITLSADNNWTYSWEGGVDDTFEVREVDSLYYECVLAGDTTNFVLNNYFSEEKYEEYESNRQKSGTDVDNDEDITEDDGEKDKENKKKKSTGTTTTTNQKTTSTTTTTTTSKKSDGAKTADNSMPLLYLALMGGALILILVAVRRRRTR